MKKIILLFVCLLPMGCIQLHYNIAPEFHSEGAVNIDGRIDADDPRVTVTVDDVTVDWKELKELIEKKMANLPKESKQKEGLAPPHELPAGALTLPAVDAAVMDTPAKPTHSVQVGAYRHLENAEQQVARLTAKGYSARMVPMADSRNKTWHTVRIGDYPRCAWSQAMGNWRNSPPISVGAYRAPDSSPHRCFWMKCPPPGRSA